MKTQISFALAVALIVCMYLVATIPSAIGQEPVQVQTITPMLWRPHVYYVPAPQIYVPQVQLVPYQYQGTQVYERQYATPIRDLFFGRYRIQHQYAPQVAP